MTLAAQLSMPRVCHHLEGQWLMCSYDAAAIMPLAAKWCVAMPTLRSYSAAPRGVRWAPQKQTLAWCTSRPASLACVPCRRWRAHCSLHALHAPTLHLPHSDCRLLLTFQQPLHMPLPKTCKHQLSGWQMRDGAQWWVWEGLYLCFWL